MVPSGRFALALALCVAVAVAATVGSISLSSDRDALPLDELLQVEQLPEGPAGSLEEHLGWTFEIFGGQQRWTEEALSGRFTSGFAEGFDVATLNAGLDQLFADFGPVRFHRVTDQDAGTIRALAVAEDGTPITIWLSLAAGGQIESMTLDEVPLPPRLPPWHTTLVVLATWSFLAAAVAASRFQDHVHAWVLLAAAPLTTSAVLILGGSRTAYTTGRILPALLVPIAIWVLARSISRRAIGAILPFGIAASVIGMAAPLTRDASLIAHPALYGSVVDSESAYRVLQALFFGVAGAAFSAVMVAAIVPVKATPRRQRAHRFGVAIVAAALGLGAMGSSVDYAVGDGGWAHGPLAAVAASGLALLPAVAVVGMIASQWDRPGIARLVIDLEADGARLDAAVAAALEDPTLQVLVSPDGHHLATQEGVAVHPEELAATRQSTEIRSGERLVGALVHDASLRHEPERLEAVAAAAGLALEVSRLNQKVTAQLEEVNASRIRIVEASDAARRQVERDLHDGAQQRLVALGLQIQRARRLAQSGRTDGLLDLLDGATVEVRDTIDDIRAVSRGAQPALLAERGLAAAVDALAERAPIPVDIDIDSIPPHIESTAYFVIAEGLTNVAKHARASNASVTVSRADGETAIRIDDDGSGGAVAAAGSGLEGLNDRVAAAGGTFQITSSATGTTLEATLPCA
ncbi:MAG: hypothetical protein GY745_24105 [Actinomycetia bacterium]|nr:hypothetical protein [Actinomycetes bacterium]MCP4088099.1 hypothetical protein [Actinomycetes bacterium]